MKPKKITITAIDNVDEDSCGIRITTTEDMDVDTYVKMHKAIAASVRKLLKDGLNELKVKTRVKN